MQSMCVTDGVMMDWFHCVGRLDNWEFQGICIIIHYTCHAIIVYCLCIIAVFNTQAFISYK